MKTTPTPRRNEGHVPDELLEEPTPQPQSTPQTPPPRFSDIAAMIKQARSAFDTELATITSERKALEDMLDELDTREAKLFKEAAEVGMVLPMPTPRRSRGPYKLNKVVEALKTNPAMQEMSGRDLAVHFNVSETLISEAKRLAKEPSVDQKV